MGPHCFKANMCGIKIFLGVKSLGFSNILEGQHVFWVNFVECEQFFGVQVFGGSRVFGASKKFGVEMCGMSKLCC